MSRSRDLLRTGLGTVHRFVRRHPVVATLGVALLVLLPGLVALASVASEHWYPAGDMAQAELHMRGFFSHPPLVGAAGRIQSDSGVQGSHPGPALWVAMYPVYLLLGRSSFGLMAAVWSVHVAATWLALWMLARRSVLLMGTFAVAIAVVVRASGPGFTLEPWNPWLAVLPFAAMLVAAWLALDEHPAWVALAVGLASYCVQCHVGYLPVTGAACAWTVGVLLVRAVRRGDRRVWWALLAAAGVTMLVWLPPIVDQLRREPGNLSILYQHFVGPREAFLPGRTVVDVLASELSALGPWVTGPALISRNRPLVLATLALWGTALVLARHRRHRSALHLHGVLAATLLGGAYSVTRIFGGYQEYTIRWFWVLTAAIVAASVWTLLSLPAGTRRPTDNGRRPWTAPTLGAAAAVGLVAFALGNVQFAARAELPGEPDSRLIGALAPATADALDRDGRYLVRWFDPVGLGATGFGLVLELERRGFHTGVDPVSAAAALPHRVLTEQQATGQLYVVLGAEIDRFRAAGYREVASADLRTDAERARFAALDVQLRRRLTEIGRPELADALDRPAGSAALLFIQPPLPHDIAEMVAEYVSLRLPASVFLVPVGTLPPGP